MKLVIVHRVIVLSIYFRFSITNVTASSAPPDPINQPIILRVVNNRHPLLIERTGFSLYRQLYTKLAMLNLYTFS